MKKVRILARCKFQNFVEKSNFEPNHKNDIDAGFDKKQTDFIMDRYRN